MTTEQKRFTAQETIQIYTDWANHYLEKARSKKRVNSLAADCSDGVLLAEVIESVTCQKIPDIVRKPKTPVQMLDNVNLCLNVLRTQHVAGVESISGQDLRDGRLKAILALFFALSRHKQATKQQKTQQQQFQQLAAQQQQSQAEMTPNRSNGPNKGGSSIPLPGSALPTRRCPPDKVRPVAATSGSRASSPALSMIPRGPPSGPASPYHQQPPGTPQQQQNQQNQQHQQHQQQQNPQLPGGKNTNTVLDKLKLFKGPTPAVTGKRTSSSSGVSSSARSERSDSSSGLSLEQNGDGKRTNNPRTKQQAQRATSGAAKNVPNVSNTNKRDVKAKMEHSSASLSSGKGQKMLSGGGLRAPGSKVEKLLQQQPPPPNNTGIPKPTAAVKGTTKQQQQQQMKEGKLASPMISRESSTVSRTAVALVSPTVKCDRVVLSGAADKDKIIVHQKEPGKGNPFSMKDSSGCQCSAPKDSSYLCPNCSYAAKSSNPFMDHQEDKENQQLLSESSHSASTTGVHSNSSDGSSVIYKPSSESGSECPNVIPNRKEAASYLSERPRGSIPEEKRHQSQSEQHLLDFHQNFQLQNLLLQRQQREQFSLEDESMDVEPMMPLLRGYGSTLTLPSTRSRQQQYGGRLGGQDVGNNGDYCEISMVNGYLSDGEMLRNHPGSSSREICDGYLSEGGSILYSRRLQTIPTHLTNGAPRIAAGLTVLTEQTSRRGRADDPPPPQPGPRPRSSARTANNGQSSQFQQQQQQQQQPQTSQDVKQQQQQWKRYTDSPGVGSPQQQQGAVPPPAPAPPSPTGTRSSRERRGSPHGAGKEKGKVRGVPQSFGYVKRGSGGAANGTNGPTSAASSTGAQNPSGKTAQVSAVPRTKVKVSGGTQTCSSDLQQSHNKGNAQFKSYSLTGNTANQLSQSVRERLMMGSQSLPKGVAVAQDYALLLRQQGRPPKASDGSLSDTQAIDNSSPYAPWLRHSNTYSVAPRLSETDSLESLSSLPGHRSSLTHHTRLLRDSPSRLSRSNSIRSTKSEKLYPSMLHRNNTEPETEPYYCLPVGSVLNHWSQPTSPAPGSARTFPLSPTHSTPRHSMPKNDDIHGSSVSLVSTASSLYSSAEEKQAHEIRKLRRELMEAQDKVQTLTSQLSTNAHVVSAFEQSLSSMTQRLQHLTATAEKKDSELAELRAAMESLRAQSLQAGIGALARQPSSDSVSSLSSACSLDKQQEKKKKKGWLRSSFTKAFSRSNNAKLATTKVQTQGVEQLDGGERQQASPPPSISNIATDSGLEVAELQKQLREKDLVLTDIRLEALSSAHQLESLKDTVMKMRSEMLSLKQNNERLQRMVTGSASTGNLPAALPSVGAPSDLTDSKSMDPLTDLLPPTEDPPPDAEPDGKRITISVYLGQPHSFPRYYAENYNAEHGPCALQTSSSGEIAVAHASVGGATSWPQLDSFVRRAFKQHVARLDPGGGLGLGADSIASYKLGEAERALDGTAPDLLPVGYVVGRVTVLHVVLQPVAALAFEALIPKGVAQRLVSLLSEHRRLVLCGAPGTGKTHLANRLAEFHAQSVGRDPAEAVATFNVDNKSGKELRQYLAHLSEQAAAGDNNVLPCVVVLDNLHKAGPLADALGSLPRNLPCLLGTMAQSACSATSLQLQHGFRWVLVAPHMEPARGLLGRVLRRRLASLELEQGPQPELAAILGWLPRVWQHLNAFLETHSSGDVAIGPRLFLSCPLELDAARAWFADVWNYSLAPYLREAAREGLQLYGRRAAWTDPCQFILDTYPWPGASPQGLTNITAKDVGLESLIGSGGGHSAQADNADNSDPLLNMLMRLQEAANYAGPPHSGESDCNGLDPNLANHTRSNGNNIGTESVS